MNPINLRLCDEFGLAMALFNRQATVQLDPAIEPAWMMYRLLAVERVQEDYCSYYLLTQTVTTQQKQWYSWTKISSGNAIIQVHRPV